jgi:predicted NAD/FAD-binding protein
MVEKKRLKVGIIGAGAAGLTTAWLLDNDYDITVFEKEDYLGGSACTVHVPIDGKIVPVEAGAEFFSDMMFPNFNRLLALLHVPVSKYPLGYTFYNTTTHEAIVLPPISAGQISWHSLTPHTIFDLVQFNHFIESGHTIIDMKDTAITLQEYSDGLILTDGFKNDFIYPFFAASWGCTPQEAKLYAAYDMLAWMIPHQPAGISIPYWNQIEGGMSIYINALAARLEHTTIHTSAPITDISYANNVYTLYTDNQPAVCVDYLIIATSENQAAELLKNIQHANQLREILSTIEFFHTTIAIHGDRRLMPAQEADWSIANILYDGKNSALTICKPHMREFPLFRSWITYNLGLPEKNPLPKPLYALRYFYHSKVNKAYFDMQKNIAPLQGKNNLWLAGFYTTGPDSHNSAIVSAMNIAKKLAPKSERLAALSS